MKYIHKKIRFVIIGIINATILTHCLLYSQTTTNYIVKECNGKPKALLILLPSLGNTPESVFEETELENIAAQNGVVTIVPKIQSNIILDDNNYRQIMNDGEAALKHYKISSQKVLIGGFSAGGTIALLLAARTVKEKAPIQPKGVIAVDPPVDLAHLWATYTKSIRQNPDSPQSQEAKILTKYMQDLVGGTPTERQDEYARYSVFSTSLATGGNIQYLKRTPILLYCEPDTAWYRTNRGYDFQDLNAACSISMIQRLQQFGNKTSQIILTQNKGYRRDGRRHPHSWSILDADYCIKWLQKTKILD